MDKEIDVWKQRNEILHKKVNRQMAEIKDLNKKNETIFDYWSSPNSRTVDGSDSFLSIEILSNIFFEKLRLILSLFLNYEKNKKIQLKLL